MSTENPPPPPPPVDPPPGTPPPGNPPAAITAPALPSPQAVLQALRAPLVGYAITFAVAVVMVVLVVIAASVDSAGGDLDPDTFHKAGVYLLAPFQLVAMALLGKLKLAQGGGTVGVLVPPLALTFTYLFTVARSSRGVVAADHAARAVLAAAVGLVPAVVITLATWALAVRDDGATIHAAGVSLFFGSWILTGLAVFVGSRHGAGMRWPVFISVEYAEAMRLWFQSVAVWVVVAVPLIAIAAGFEEGPWFALLFPIWAVTGGLYTYSIGHFAGIGALGQSVDVFDFSTLWTIVALLGTVLVTLVTAVAWSLRRNRDPEWLSNPTSWTVLPSIYFGGALLVWLIPSINLGGGYGGIGGSLTVRPSPLLFATLPIAGLITEFLSRTVAASLAAGLSPALATRLRRTPVTPPAAAAPVGAVTGEPGAAPAAVAPVPRAPLTPEERRRWRRIGIVGAVVVVLLGGGWITIAAINSSSYSAEATAEKYLDAVVEGDLDAAVELAPVDAGDARSELLTKSVYKTARHKITGYTLGKSESFGDTTSITAHLKGTEGDSEVHLRLTKKGKTNVFFDNWRIEDGGVASKTSFELPEGSDSVSVGDSGVSITKSGDYWVYPGSYTFNPYGDSKWVEAGAESTIEPGSYGYADFSDAQPTQAFEDEVNRQLTAYLDACMAAKTLETPECPNDSYQSDARNVKWTMTKAPVIDFDSFDGTFPADLSVDSGTASVTYEYDQNYGFGPKDYVTDSDDDVSLYLSITVEEDGDGLKVTFDG